MSGLAADRRNIHADPVDDLVATGGSGFGIMAIIVAVERGWVSRGAALERLECMIDLLIRATCYHGVFPHFMNGSTGAAIPFTRKDDGGDLVENPHFFSWDCCAPGNTSTAEPLKRPPCATGSAGYGTTSNGTGIHGGDRKVLYWHWSPSNGWALDLDIRGWNEGLVTYVLAAGAPRYAVGSLVYHRGFAAGRDFVNGKSLLRHPAPPGDALWRAAVLRALFLLRHGSARIDGSLCRLLDQCVRHVSINHAHCEKNPFGHKGYSGSCWGLTASR